MSKLIKLVSLKADVTLEADGEWIPVKNWPGIGDLPGLKFKVRSTNYPEYLTAKNNRQVQIATKHGNDHAPHDELNAADGELAAEYLLLDWNGLDEEYSRNAALGLLTSPEGRIFRNMIYWCAGQVGKRQVEFLETAEKN